MLPTRPNFAPFRGDTLPTASMNLSFASSSLIPSSFEVSERRISAILRCADRIGRTGSIAGSPS